MHVVSHFFFYMVHCFPRKKQTQITSLLLLRRVDRGGFESQHERTIGTQIVSSRAWVMLSFPDDATGRSKLNAWWGWIYLWLRVASERTLSVSRFDCSHCAVSQRLGPNTMGYYFVLLSGLIHTALDSSTLREEWERAWMDITVNNYQGECDVIDASVECVTKGFEWSYIFLYS